MSRKMVPVFVMWLSVVSGCDRWRNSDTLDLPVPSRGDEMLKVVKHVISSDSLTIAYRVTNVKDYPIWVCDGLNQVGRAETTTEGSTLYLKMFSRGLYPEGVLVYAPPTGFYSKLSPGESLTRTIQTEVPIRRSSLRGSIERGQSRARLRPATHIVVEIGYFTQEAIDASEAFVRSLPEDKLEVAALEMTVPEDVIAVSISGVSIPIAIQVRD
jgi:hypothetical protein